MIDFLGHHIIFGATDTESLHIVFYDGLRRFMRKGSHISVQEEDYCETPTCWQPAGPAPSCL